MDFGLNNLINFLKTDLITDSPLKFGKHYFLINYQFVFLGLFFIGAYYIRDIKKMATNPRSIADLRTRALPGNKGTKVDGSKDLQQEVREMRLKVELLCEEVRALRREISTSSNAPVVATAPPKGYQRAYPAISYPLPESRFD